MNRFLTALAFGGFYLREILASNLRVARDALTPRPRIAPGVVRIPCTGMTERQMFAYASLLTMTPGTLSMEVLPKEGVILVHTLYSEPSPDALRAQLKETYEKPIRRIF